MEPDLSRKDLVAGAREELPADISIRPPTGPLNVVGYLIRKQEMIFDFNTHQDSPPVVFQNPPICGDFN